MKVKLILSDNAEALEEKINTTVDYLLNQNHVIDNISVILGRAEKYVGIITHYPYTSE